MYYRDLDELISSEKHGREYFYSLPQVVQSELSAAGSTIHNTAELHHYARSAGERIRGDILAARGYR